MIKMNGVEKQFTKSVSIAELLKDEEYITANVAVELNGEIVKRTAFETHLIKDGDVIEIVKFVGGG